MCTRRERRNLALALKDTRSVVGTLTYVMGAIMQLVFFFFYLLILQVWQTAALPTQRNSDLRLPCSLVPRPYSASEHTR